MIRYRLPTVRDLISASLEAARLSKRFPELGEALVANACLVARSARLLCFRRFRSGAHVLRRMTATQISTAARKAATCGMGDGGMDALKKSLRARRLSGSHGVRADLP